MATWALDMADFQIEVEGLDASTGAVCNLVTALVKSLVTLHEVVPVAVFHVERDAVDLTKYAYRITLQDGRAWRQFLFFPAGQEVRMTFNVQDQWTLGEFVPHRAIRDLTVQLVQQFGCPRLHAAWSAE